MLALSRGHSETRLANFKVCKPHGLQAWPPRRFASSPPIRYEEFLACCACGTCASVYVIKHLKFITETKFADGKVCKPSLLASSPPLAGPEYSFTLRNFIYNRNNVCKPQGSQTARLTSCASSPIRLLASDLVRRICRLRLRDLLIR